MLSYSESSFGHYSQWLGEEEHVISSLRTFVTYQQHNLVGIICESTPYPWQFHQEPFSSGGEEVESTIVNLFILVRSKMVEESILFHGASRPINLSL